MSDLYVILEEWAIEDGNYPLLNKNDKLNIAFEMEFYDFEIVKKEEYLFENIKYSEYNFCGKIIYKYSNIIIVDTGIMKFYVESKNNLKIGKFIKGNGKLLIDCYVWAENINKYKNCPDIFYNVLIKKLFSVKISEKFIKRFDGGISYPSSLKSNDINEKDIIEIEKMKGNEKYDMFFLLKLEQIDEEIKRTFNL
ncbi:MAG: hypothetical protein LBP89_02360 [Helicobacteraceae bacterium]|nr:hypothetical protein [Helicobacteraceae bacterium]